MSLINEKQKMLAGKLYLPADLALTDERKQARQFTYEYNATQERETEKRLTLLQELLGTIGTHTKIMAPFYCDYGYNIHIQDSVYLNFGCVILDSNRVHIGNDVQIGPYVQIYTVYHPIDPAVRLEGKELASPITIKDNAWIGGGAIICPGVTIGQNSTIGAGSVVVKDIPDNVVAVGNPCRVIKFL